MLSLPEPLLSSSVKTGSMGCMLLDFNRLIGSDFYALSTGDEFKAAIALWSAAWAQTPAGSLPSDERILASISRSKSWKKVRDRALHGFILCSDNRYYHRVLCEKALEVFEKREKFLEKNEKNLMRQQKWRDRAKNENTDKRNKANSQAGDFEGDFTEDHDSVTRYDDVTDGVTLALHNAHKEKVKVKVKSKEKEKDLDQEQEQELRALRARAEEQKNNTKKVDAQGSQQSESESAAASQLPAAVAACTFENLDLESLESASDLAQPALSKKAVSKRVKSTKPSANGIDLSKLPSQISAMAAEAVIAMRKSRRNPFVQISFDRFIARVLEASAEIGISADDVIFEIIDAGWMGFRIDWLKARLSTTQKSGAYKPRFSDLSAADKTAARSLEYADFLTNQMTSEIADAVTIDAIAVGD